MRFKILLLGFIVVLVSFSLTSLAYSLFIIQDIQEIDMKVKIEDVVGMDVNDSVISFGIIPKHGGSSQREITLENMEDKQLRVFVKQEGMMAEWVHVSEERFVLDRGEEKKLFFTCAPPKDVEKGSYSGKARFIYLREI